MVELVRLGASPLDPCTANHGKEQGTPLHLAIALRHAHCGWAPSSSSPACQPWGATWDAWLFVHACMRLLVELAGVSCTRKAPLPQAAGETVFADEQAKV